jgi:hypothetical protein
LVVRVPPNVIEMQVRIDHDVDIFGLDASRTKVPQEVRLQHRELRQRPLLAVAAASVEQDRLALTAQHEGLGGSDVTRLVRAPVFRHEPVSIGVPELTRNGGCDPFGGSAPRAYEFQDTCHGDVAEQ